MEQVKEMFKTTRHWRMEYRRRGDGIQAAACAIREEAFLDVLKSMGATPEQIKELRGNCP